MARSDKRYSVYPSPWAVEIAGATAPELNRAIECWAMAIGQATPCLTDDEAEFVKDVMGGIGISPCVPTPAKVVADVVARLDGKLARKIECLSYVETWAALMGVRSSSKSSKR